MQAAAEVATAAAEQEGTGAGLQVAGRATVEVVVMEMAAEVMAGVMAVMVQTAVITEEEEGEGDNTRPRLSS